MSRRTWRGILTPKYEQPGASDASGHDQFTPFTAPAVRPNAIRRCTSRKKITTGIAINVEAAITAPQSTPRAPPRKFVSQTVIVCFELACRMHAREDVLVPAVMNAKTDVATRPGRDERQQDADEGADPGRAVDHRGLLELLRDADAGSRAASRPQNGSANVR